MALCYTGFINHCEVFSMDYNALLDLATDLGYELAMAGAETFRVEESISRCLQAYGVECEVFAIPNYLVVSILDEQGHPITRMRRIGHHGNNLDAVEKFSGLSRAFCNRKPEPKEGMKWFDIVRENLLTYPLWVQYLGYFLGSVGYGLFFGGNWMDAFCAGLCGLLVGFSGSQLDKMKANPFFKTIASAFFMALLAYALGAVGLAKNPDAVSIGALMILVPGLLFTNAMRDIIYGDTNSGVNRIVQVLLIAVALALGTAAAWNVATALWGAPVSAPAIAYSIPAQCLYAFLGCLGFTILFNIHFPGGILCMLGGALSWAVYCIALELGGSELTAYFWSSLFASAYSETMARIRKYPAISYLVVSLFPMIPGAGVYYTMTYAVQGNMDRFASRGMFTAAIAGIMAVGILLGSTVFRMYSDWKMHHK